MPSMFQPYSLKDVTLRNRIVVPPMCQYQATDGLPGSWHPAHYASLARGGTGLVIVEATAVSPEGRITPACLGLWSDEQAQALAPNAQANESAGSVPGIQIAHAGRKADANVPWEGDDHIKAGDPRYWETIAPSPIAFGGGLDRVPREMTLDDIRRVQADFVAAAQRALDAGFRWLELHLAHGYLAQSFFSVHSNQRTDEYGGNAENRGRFLRETIAAVRKVWPEHLPLTARFGVLEYDGRDEETLTESIELTRQFKHEGLDLLSVSAGFSTSEANIPWKESGFLAPISQRVSRETGLPVSVAWNMGQPEIASKVIENGQADLVQVGKGHLADPHWTYAAAKALGETDAGKWLPPSYEYWLRRY